jgi:type IX secretion system PorP/SprF family membrane protein
MKKILLSALLLAFGATAWSQQDPQFTQNMFNRLGVNAGVAGTGGVGTICGVGIFREQNMGFAGNPQTMLFSVDGGFYALRQQHGAGLTVWQDQLGAEKTLMLKGAYAWQKGLMGGKLGIGLEGGLISKSINDDWIATDDYQKDPSIPSNGTSDMAMDLGFGIYFQRADMYVGLSSTHLVPGKIEAKGISDSAVNWIQEYAVARHLYVMAGYNYQINPTMVLQPSVFIKTDPASPQFDINCNLEYNKMFWGGLSYRLQDAAALLVGMDFVAVQPSLSGLKLGIAYDFTLSQLRNYSSGSVEVMLKYCKKITKEPKVQRYKSVRFL